MTEPLDPVEPVDDENEDADAEAVRRLLQGLPEVAPPDGFYDGLIRQRRRRARTVAGVCLVAAGVAGAVVVAQATGITGEVNPPVSILASRHEDITIEEGGLQGDRGDDVPAPYQAPDHLAGMTLGFTVQHPDHVVQVVYGAEGHWLSVFEQAGDLQDEALDLDLTPLDVPGVEAWQTSDGVVIARREDVVYVLVGDLDTEHLAEVLDELPDARPMGMARRIGDAMDDLVDAFGLG